jgi:hypothetical protein
MSNEHIKLYTEEQVKMAIQMSDKYHYLFDDEEDGIIKTLTPIELPSDEEIEDASLEDNNDDLSPAEEFQQGAKWMRDKIGGNNEP